MYTNLSYFGNDWLGIVENEWDLIDHGTVKQVNLTNDLMNWADQLDDFCMLTVMGKCLF